jgi:hypothetical protein
MARGLIGNIQKEAQRQSNVNPKLSLEEGKAPAPTTNATAEQPKKKKWFMPVVIGGGVLIVGILTYVLLKRKK